MNDFERQDAIDLVYDAQEHLNAAIESLRQYVAISGDRHTEAYILDHLRIYATRDHGYLSNDPNLDDVIDGLESYNEEDVE